MDSLPGLHASTAPKASTLVSIRSAARTRASGHRAAIGVERPRGQVVVQVCYHLSAIADRRSHSFCRTGTYIADREDPGATRFQRPPAGLAARQHESPVIERD